MTAKHSVGIIKCDELDESIQPQTGVMEELFIGPMSCLDQHLSFDVFDARNGHLPDNLEDYHSYVITGSIHDAFGSEPWVESLRNWIQGAYQARKKLVGVCFGHQVIAHSLEGGRTEESIAGWAVGTTRPKVVKRPDWMEDHESLDDFPVYVSHRDQVTQLPAGAELIATTDYCPNFMFHIDDQVLGIQGHPEFCKVVASNAARKRLPYMSESERQTVEHSLTIEPNKERMLNWMIQFMRQPSVNTGQITYTQETDDGSHCPLGTSSITYSSQSAA